MKENKKSMSEQVRRYIIFALGLMFMGFGVACLIKSSLGVSPISSLPYTFALILPVLTVMGISYCHRKFFMQAIMACQNQESVSSLLASEKMR